MVEKTVLANGVRVITEKIPFLHSVSTGIWVNAGSRDEQDHERGITHFIEHMLFKGTARRTALDIAKELDAVGGFSNAFTSKENVCFHAKVLDTHLPLVVDVLTDIFLNSVVSEVEVERERQVILQEISMIEDIPDEQVHILFQEEYWRDHPLGWPIYGSADTVSRLGRRDILHYMHRAFHPEKIVVAAAGNLEHHAFVDLVAPSLEALNSTPEPSRRLPPTEHPIHRVLRKDLEQVHICLGMPGCSQAHPARFACHLLNTVLGASMSSRLFQEVREKRGLAYSVYSFTNSHEDTGLLGIYAGVAPQQVEPALQVIRDELVRLAEEPISEAEFAAAKEYLKGSMYLNAESTDSRMNRLAKNEFTFGRHVSLEEVEALVDQVTPEEARSWFAGAFRPNRIGLLLLGPAHESQIRAFVG